MILTALNLLPLKKFELTASEYRSKLQTVRRAQEKTYTQFSNRLQSYLLNWEKPIEFSHSYEGLSEMFLADTIRETMPKIMQTFLIESFA